MDFYKKAIDCIRDEYVNCVDAFYVDDKSAQIEFISYVRALVDLCAALEAEVEKEDKNE